MKLNVLADAQLWYEDGLQFTCSQCGNCCTGGPGYVWITRQEIARLAEHLGISAEETVEKYCRKVDGRFSLKERRTPSGNYDCIFLTDQPVQAGNGKPTQSRRICSVYPVRPLQCRTWPFWKENLRSKELWDHAAKRCHGMNGGRRFSLEQVEAIRDAAQWPKDPPTSEMNNRAV